MDRREAIGAMIGLAATPVFPLDDAPSEYQADWTPAMVNASGFGFDIPAGSSIDVMYTVEDGYVVLGSVRLVGNGRP